MPISERIKNKIMSLNESEDLKELMLAILIEEDKGKYQFKGAYESLVNVYLKAKEEDDDQDN